MAVSNVRDVGFVNINTPGEQPAVERGARGGASYGKPVEPMDSYRAGGPEALRERQAVSAPRGVQKYIEAMMTAEGRRIAGELPDVYQKKLEDACDTFRGAGYSENEVGAMRFCVARKIKESGTC